MVSAVDAAVEVVVVVLLPGVIVVVALLPEVVEVEVLLPVVAVVITIIITHKPLLSLLLLLLEVVVDEAEVDTKPCPLGWLVNSRNKELALSVAVIVIIIIIMDQVVSVVVLPAVNHCRRRALSPWMMPVVV